MSDAITKDIDMHQRRTQTRKFRSLSEADTIAFGRQLGARLSDSTTISLAGALGAGKSVLARAICQGLGVEEDVASPSFILVEEYAGRLPVIHCDLYRLKHESELEALGLFDRMQDDVVMIAEWGDRSPYLFEAADVAISIRVTGDQEREMDVDFAGEYAGVFDLDTGV